uniref:NADH-ubiquinone oxidoreductase chain 6 n=1 Tax=Cromna sinensis TaxID=2844952 RepID=A0A8H2SMZ6_9HEMI|nr:NADH dehydrogenase subunit 6 [Cromna sinensis]
MTKLMMITTLITPIMKHPMSLGSVLITQTILMSTIMSKKSNSTWYSYILFITMIGGLMIMFMYMSSIASNEMFKTPSKKKMLMILTLMIMISLMNENEPMITWQSMEMNKMNFMEIEEVKSTSKFFNSNKLSITILMILTLLLTMVSVTNISSSFEGPLKKTYV